MKVLWFTNTPSLAVKRLHTKVIGGSWISSIEKEIISFLKSKGTNSTKTKIIKTKTKNKIE